MDVLNDLYHKSVAENEQNLRFWDNYLQNLKSLDFNEFSKKLKVPVLVPIGSRILFRGELKHTNEVTVALGADYFVKCSLAQADILRQHRIKVAQEKVDTYSKERDYLQNQMSFAKQNVYDDQGKEIIEYETEEEDKAWRLKHTQNIKDYMQKRAKEKQNENSKNDVTDEKLWERLEELELQEELDNEFNDFNDNNLSLTGVKENKAESIVVKEEDYLTFSGIKKELEHKQKDEVKSEKEMKNKHVSNNTDAKTPEPTLKLDLLQKVIDRQNELDEKLHELKNRERSGSKTEKDLMARLDEMEQLDELEDEMDRLDDIIENEDIVESEEEPSLKSTKLQRRVSFVDEDDSETLNLTFKHSDVQPKYEPYNPQKGIQKPSDIYEAHSHLFGIPTSILKKSKYATHKEVSKTVTSKPVINIIVEVEPKQKNPEDPITYKTIVIKDVVEKIKKDEKKHVTETKPVSLFKKKRMLNKSK